MSSRVPAVVAVLLLAAAPGLAQDWYEPNPSLAELSADDAYARTSAKSLKAARIGAAVAIRLDDAGRVVVAGGSRIARLDSGGRLDPTFGVAGVAELPVEGSTTGLEIDSAGRIVVVGSFRQSTSDGSGAASTVQTYLAARLLADGSLDPAFSGDGLLEFDAASNLDFRAVRAAGSDGAMLAVVAKTPDPGSSYYPSVGLVRITADGTLDATYGGGFAQVARGSWVEDGPGFVADFAVDSAGRAVVAVQNDYYGRRTALRLDAAGGPDPSFYGYTSYVPGYVFWDSFAASQVAFDGAGRIVGLADAGFLRRLPDGAPDAAFAGDGFAWHQATGFDRPILFDVNERDGQELLQDLAELAAVQNADPDFDGDPLDGGELLAVATLADRWVTAKPVSYRDSKGRVVARGIGVQAIDPANPGAIVSTAYRSADPNFSRVAGLVIAPDGTSAYALGDTFVLRVDLTSQKPMPLPDLRAQWLGYVRTIDLGGSRYRVSARVRIRNVSSRDASVVGDVGFGDGSLIVPLAPIYGVAKSSRPFTVRARSSVLRRFTWEGTYRPADLAGGRLSVRVRSELPDANFADNTATSPPITPVYAPR